MVLPMQEVAQIQCGDTSYSMRISKLTLDFQEISKNWEAFMFLYIETCSFIDEEPYWDVYSLFTDSKRLVGYCTFYCSYIHKEMSRLRISQFVIMPDYQRKGIGRLFLSNIMQHST